MHLRHMNVRYGHTPGKPGQPAPGGGVQLELSHSCRHAPHVGPLIESIACFVLGRQ
jgi:hypothetical protein